MSTPLRILQVTKSTAGAAEYVRWLVGGLDPARFQMTVACLSENGPQFAAELGRLPGVRAFSLAMPRYTISPLADGRVLLRLAAVARRERFDIIHAHASKPGFLARLAAAGSDTPTIYTPHCWSFHPGVAPWKARILVALERAAAPLASRFVTVCEDERQRALRHGVGRPEQLITIHSGIEPAPYDAPVDRAAVRASLGIPASAPLIGAVGRLSPQKAPLDLIRAAAVLREARPDAHVVWAGSGPLEGAARALVAELGLEQSFHFAGQRNDIPALLGALDGFALASHWEGFAISTLEAMAARLPVLTTRVDGAAEAVEHGVSGLIVPIGDHAALGAAMLELLADPARARAMGAAGRERLEQRFGRRRMLEQMAALYSQLGEK